MTAKQFGQKDQATEQQNQKQGSFGQQEARLDKDKQSELSHMGKKSPETAGEKNKRD
jgi:hypothetical protein